jgi:uncharacterized damage-inducible protein DinB
MTAYACVRGLAARAITVAAVAGMMSAAGAVAQDHADHQHQGMAMPESGIRAELIRDVDQLEGKYIALAEAMASHMDWRPGEGVRSAGEVFGHLAAGNFMIPSMAGADLPSRYQGDEGRAALRALEQARGDELVEALRHSFMHVRHAIARAPDDALDTPTRFFGRDATNREVLVLLVSHMHEHLGQAIAYARTNGVRPPWSGG